MRYFQLTDDVHVRRRWHLGDLASSAGDPPDLLCGVPYDHGAELSVPVHVQGEPLDFSLTSFGVPVTTKRLFQAIAAIAGDGVQEIPLEVVGHSGFIVPHATREISCLAESLSEFEKWTEGDSRPDLVGGYRQVSRLVLDANAIPQDVHFFRVEGWPVALIVSSAVREAMEAAGCRGARFQEVTGAASA